MSTLLVVPFNSIIHGMHDCVHENEAKTEQAACYPTKDDQTENEQTKGCIACHHQEEEQEQEQDHDKDCHCSCPCHTSTHLVFFIETNTSEVSFSLTANQSPQLHSSYSDDFYTSIWQPPKFILVTRHI